MTTLIEWAAVPDGKGGFKIPETLNPQVGCREVSPACRNCYAAKLAHRGMSAQHRGLTVLRADGPHWNGEINRVPELLAKPLHWKKPRGIFWGSMTDIFYSTLDEEDMRFIAAIFGVAAATPRHTHILLTKRPENARRFFDWLDEQAEGLEDAAAQARVCLSIAAAVLAECGAGTAGDRDRIRTMRAYGDITWPLPNVWLGVTAEDQQRADERIPVLLELPAAVRFVSYEPAVGPIEFPRVPSGDGLYDVVDSLSGQGFAGGKAGPVGEFEHINWVIGGGESGAGARPSHPDWFRSARDQCEQAGVPFFFKQWGEWAPEVAPNRGPKLLMSSTGEVADAGRYGRECVLPVDNLIINGRPALAGKPGRVVLARYGKTNTGRELDGRTWDGFPAVSS